MHLAWSGRHQIVPAPGARRKAQGARRTGPAGQALV